jgi:MerR family transcriptional regulator, light-induced transcriptional regulator
MAGESAVRGDLEGALRAYDRAAAVAAAMRALDDGLSIPDLYTVLSGILVEVGSAWQSGTAEVWQEHYVTGVVRTIVEACVLRVEEAAPSERHATVVLAAPNDEYHDLGLRMLADRFALAGWHPHFLGANVPITEVMGAVRELGADAVALSASTHFHRLSLRAYVTAISEAHPDLQLWVGGPAFAHGHDGWADEMVLDPRAIPSAGDR